MFLGNSPDWYKNTIIAFLIINPMALLILNAIELNGTFIVGWMVLLEFIFTLALALKCYPLQPGGLIAIQALFLGLTKLLRESLLINQITLMITVQTS